jgi:excisionase family DNA binding protein
LSTEPAKNPFDALVETFRQVVREEIAAALDKQSEKPAKLLFTTAESAAVLGVPETWLATQARAGKIPCVRLGHYVRFRLTDLEKILDQSGES